jgi:pimeloyl-ACP methyl ester carboxylesterase
MPAQQLPAYFTAGTGSAVVLLHCTLSSKNQWRPLCALLEPQHQVIALDLYGYGDTPMPEKREGYTLWDEAELVLALLDHLLPAGARVQLVGHSFGGAVALCFSHRYPDRVKSLTVFEPVAFHLLPQGDPGFASVLEMQETLSRLIAAGQGAQAAATFLDFWSGAGSFANFPPRVQQDFARRTPKLALDFQAITATPLTLEDYGRLALPVSVIAGTQSPEPGLRVARELGRILPPGSLTWVPTSHMGPVSHPGLVNPVILDALAD